MLTGLRALAGVKGVKRHEHAILFTLSVYTVTDRAVWFQFENS
jgi:hypothetical protein